MRKAHLNCQQGKTFDPAFAAIIPDRHDIGLLPWLETEADDVGFVDEQHITLALDPTRPTIMYAGTSGGMYKTVNRAVRWEKVNNGLVPAVQAGSPRAGQEGNRE